MNPINDTDARGSGAQIRRAQKTADKLAALADELRDELANTYGTVPTDLYHLLGALRPVFYRLGDALTNLAAQAEELGRHPDLRHDQPQADPRDNTAQVQGNFLTARHALAVVEQRLSHAHSGLNPLALSVRNAEGNRLNG